MGLSPEAARSALTHAVAGLLNPAWSVPWRCTPARSLTTLGSI